MTVAGTAKVKLGEELGSSPLRQPKQLALLGRVKPNGYRCPLNCLSPQFVIVGLCFGALKRWLAQALAPYIGTSNWTYPKQY